MDVPKSIWNVDQIAVSTKFPIDCDALKHKDVTANENFSVHSETSFLFRL